MSQYQTVLFIIWIFFNWGFKLSAQTPVSPSIGKTNFTIDEISKFVKLFNEVRSRVIPSAANMNYVQWDSEIADNAYYDVAGCGSEISSKKITYRGNFTDVASIIESWSNEVFNYDIQANKCVGQNSCFNYIQMVHAEVKKIGCGIKYCSYKKEYLVSCYLDESSSNTDTPYLIGKPCTHCQSKFCFQNLCITQDLCNKEGLNCKDLSNFENTSCIVNRENQTDWNHEENGQNLEKEKNDHLHVVSDINSRKVVDDKSVENNDEIKVDFAATTKIATVKTKIGEIITKEISNSFITDSNTDLNYPDFTKTDKSIKSDDFTELYQPGKNETLDVTPMITEIVDITGMDLNTVDDDYIPEFGKGKGFPKIWPNGMLVMMVTTLVISLALNTDKI